MTHIIDASARFEEQTFEVISELGRCTAKGQNAGEVLAAFQKQYGVCECMVFVDGEVPEHLTWDDLKRAARRIEAQW